MFKAALDTCFSKFDFHVVANLGSFLLLHVLYMSITEMHIYYVKVAPNTCFSTTVPITHKFIEKRAYFFFRRALAVKEARLGELI